MRGAQRMWGREDAEGAPRWAGFRGGRGVGRPVGKGWQGRQRADQRRRQDHPPRPPGGPGAAGRGSGGGGAAAPPTFQAADPPEARVREAARVLLLGGGAAVGRPVVARREVGGVADEGARVQPVVGADGDGHEAEGGEGAHRGHQHLHPLLAPQPPLLVPALQRLQLDRGQPGGRGPPPGQRGRGRAGGWGGSRRGQKRGGLGPAGFGGRGRGRRGRGWAGRGQRAAMVGSWWRAGSER